MNNQELRIELLLDEVLRKGASDLHIQVGIPPMIRVDGKLVEVANCEPLDQETARRIVLSTLDDDQRQIYLKDKEFDFSFAYGNLGRFRVNVFHERGNMAAALRLISGNIRSIQDLGLPSVVTKFAEFPRG